MFPRLASVGTTLTGALCCSGLTKGYVESLEHRLAATEHAFLQLLSVVGDDVVESAYRCADTLDDDPSAAASAVPAGIAGRGEGQKTDLLACWEQFPLQTAVQVREWAKQTRRSPARSSPERLIGHPASPTLPNTVGRLENPIDSADNNDSAAADAALHPTPSPGRELWTNNQLGLDESTSPLSDHRSGEGDAQSFGLSLDFRKQFLW